METTDDDICLKTSVGSHMKQMLIITLCCKVSMTIPNWVTVKMQIMLCWSWSNIPTVPYMIQLASMVSISCNIQHLAQQQCQHKIYWLIIRKKPVWHHWWAHMAYRQRDPHDDIIKLINGRASLQQKWSEPSEHFTGSDLNCNLPRWNDEKHTFQQQREIDMDQVLCRQTNHCGKKTSWRRSDSDYARAGSYEQWWNSAMDNQKAWKKIWGDIRFYQRQSKWSCKIQYWGRYSFCGR